MSVVYKIRNPAGLFSHGVIVQQKWDGVWRVHWSKTGKEWKTEKAVKAHLAKALKTISGVSSWEIVTMEVIYHPTKPIDEWVDNKMLVAILKQ